MSNEESVNQNDNINLKLQELNKVVKHQTSPSQRTKLAIKKNY